VGNVITNRNASRLEFERLLVRIKKEKHIDKCDSMRYIFFIEIG